MQLILLKANLLNSINSIEAGVPSTVVSVPHDADCPSVGWSAIMDADATGTGFHGWLCVSHMAVCGGNGPVVGFVSIDINFSTTVYSNTYGGRSLE